MNHVKPFSLIKGYSFDFTDGDNEIGAWFSCFSGLERVFVDGELISEQRNYSKSTASNFKIGDDEFSVVLEVTSLLRGPFVCTLSKNGVDIKRKKLVFPERKTNGFWIPLLTNFVIFFILGITLIYSKYYFGYSDMWLYISIGASLVVALLFDFIKNKKHQTGDNLTPVIVEEEIV
ncbi:MAG: hypothetical protein KAT25_05805 [Sulfuriflexus sp.]|nr:hypothetical protein [Sulfuriflexus sp.]